MTSRMLTRKSRSPRNSRWPPIPFPLWLLDYAYSRYHAHLAYSEPANLQSRLSGGSLPVAEVSALQRQDPFLRSSAKPPRKAAASQDWLPHVPNPEND